MADLSITYSKTPKGLRARSSLIGGLSGKLFKVLSFIDGISKAQTILTKFDDISADKLLSAITKLENEGYIKPTAASVFDDDDWDFDSSPVVIVHEELQIEEVESVLQQADEVLAALEIDRQNILVEQAKLAEQAELAKQAEKAREIEKSQQQLALIKAIETAKAQTKVQEKIDIEQAAAAQKKLKLESLTKIKAEQLRIARALAEESLKNAEVQRLAAQAQIKQEQAKQARDNFVQQIQLQQSAKVKLAVAAEQVRNEKIALLAAAEVRKAEKAAKIAQKIAFAETEQLRLMAEFEENAKREAAAVQQAERAELATAAKRILKAKAEARTKAELEALALRNTAQKMFKS